MELNEESVSAYTKILKTPSEHGIPIRPLSECFEDCETATPKHVLFNEYKQDVGENLPKVMFYIIMDSEYPQKIAKAESGELGYLLKYIPNPTTTQP